MLLAGDGERVSQLRPQREQRVPFRLQPLQRRTFRWATRSFPGLGTFPNLQIYELNNIQLGPDPNAPQYTIQNLYQFVDNVSWVKGKHNFRFGGEFRWIISPQTFTQRVRGDYEWNFNVGLPERLAPNPDNGDFGERSAGDVIYYGNKKAVLPLRQRRVAHYAERHPQLRPALGMDRQACGIPVAVAELHRQRAGADHLRHPERPEDELHAARGYCVGAGLRTPQLTLALPWRTTLSTTTWAFCRCRRKCSRPTTPCRPSQCLSSQLQLHDAQLPGQRRSAELSW